MVDEIVDEIQSALAELSNPEDALFLQKYFKTGPGQYGEGDLFRGIRVPELRKLAKVYRRITLEQAEQLLRSACHEDRLLALLILVHKYSDADETGKTRIYESYLNHARFINNWDLVDCSARHIIGPYLRGRSRAPLYRLAGSSLLWERRMAVLATFHFINTGEFDDALKIAGMLLNDSEDLIHKAVGWMLREVGKIDPRQEEEFLDDWYRHMPRTMLRYAIERFPEEKRLAYLKGTIPVNR